MSTSKPVIIINVYITTVINNIKLCDRLLSSVIKLFQDVKLPLDLK
jgi:hypothetical protein